MSSKRVLTNLLTISRNLIPQDSINRNPAESGKHDQELPPSKDANIPGAQPNSSDSPSIPGEEGNLEKPQTVADGAKPTEDDIYKRMGNVTDLKNDSIVVGSGIAKKTAAENKAQRLALNQESDKVLNRELSVISDLFKGMK